MQKKIVVLVLLTVAIAAFATPACAVRSAGEIAEATTEEVGSIGKLVVAVAAVVGVILVLIGFLELKKASNKRRGDGSVGAGITCIIIGCALASIIFITASGSKTIHGDEGAMSERINSFSN